MFARPNIQRGGRFRRENVAKENPATRLRKQNAALWDEVKQLRAAVAMYREVAERLGKGC
jgi:hypothetical protein